MHYYAYELAHTVVSPMRFWVHNLHHTLHWPFNPIANTPLGRNIAAACEVFENMTRRYGKPAFGLKETHINGVAVPVREHAVMRTPWCSLLHFERDARIAGRRYDPKILMIAPMSGHYATLLRGTVKAMLPDHETYVTDWADARDVPLAVGRFDLDDFIDHVIAFVRFLGPDTHVIAVCQPAVPALAATALMAAMDDPCQPSSLTLIGGPIDARRNPTMVNRLAYTKSVDWFERNVITMVPFPHPGFMRPVYPGFMQLTGFMTMNLDRHMYAHVDLFNNLIKGDCDSVRQHQEFYEEYMAVMDLTAEFYLQTMQTVFQDYALARGTMTHRGEPIDCSMIRNTALMTVEGERDDVCGASQTQAAHDLCGSIPADEKVHYRQEGVGHFGAFNGTRWRTEIQPRVREFIRAIDFKRAEGSGWTRYFTAISPAVEYGDVHP